MLSVSQRHIRWQVLLGWLPWLCWGPWLLSAQLASGQSPAGAETNAYVPDPDAFRAHTAAFFSQHCLRCHGPEDAQGEFRTDRDLSAAFDDLTTAAKWREVVNVLNSHEMPPEDEPQPSAAEVAELVDWITAEMIRVEQHRRDTTIVLRRMNRDEYHNTIRDLVDVDYDTSHFPEDPPTGGFDNNGGALVVSPLHLELYYNAARQILDAAFVEGEQPPSIRWRFQPESGDSDRNRVEYDGQRLIVNAGKNRVENDFIVMHHDSWDRTFNVRDFRLEHPGKYIVRIRAGGRVPTRKEVLESATGFLQRRLDEAVLKHPDQADRKRQQMERDLEHFRTYRDYDYGRPRIKVTQKLAGQPKVIAEFDIDADVDQPQIIEIETDFSTASAGLTIEYAYDIPKELENFWMQRDDAFARPEAWIDWMELEGPIYPQWPPASQTRLLFDSPNRDRHPRAYAREVIVRFMQRAYRRRVSAAEVDAKLALFDAAHQDGLAFQAAIKRPLAAILVSPHFLFLAEPPATGDGPVGDGPADDNSVNDGLVNDGPVASPSNASRPLDDFQLATRLSYFLWSSMPDDDLFRAAARGQLRTAQHLQAQIDRMLASPKSEAFVENFTGQWLGLREVGANPPAAELHRRYDRHLETSIVQESLGLFREILHNDLSVMHFIDSDFIVINERLARFYGIDGVRGDDLRRVNVPADVHRGGVLTQAAMLSITSNGTRTSPVKRGTWILKNILGTDPGLPVANAGEIAPKVPGIDKATVRQRLEIHRSLPQCARCHNKIDPLGFALENYDASGDWRLREGHGYQGRIGENDPLIDATSKLPDGTELDGIESLQQALMHKQDLFMRCLAEKMLTYALGRELGVVDRPQVQAAVEHLQTTEPTLRELIRFIVRSPSFQSK